MPSLCIFIDHNVWISRGDVLWSEPNICFCFLYVYMYVPSPSATERIQHLGSTAGLYSGFSFFLDAWPSLSYYLRIAGWRRDGFKPIPKVIRAKWNAISFVQNVAVFIMTYKSYCYIRKNGGMILARPKTEWCRPMKRIYHSTYLFHRSIQLVRIYIFCLIIVEFYFPFDDRGVTWNSEERKGQHKIVIWKFVFLSILL